MEFKTFEDLEVYRAGREFRKKIYKLIKKLPEEEKFNLVGQMRRAATSLTNNIAEGYGRYHYQENIQFCRQARGSLYELIDHVDVALECEHIDDNQAESLIKETKQAIRILNGYIKYLKNRKENGQ